MSPQLPSTAELELARERITVFERRYGKLALDLACHAAFPMTLTAELVYCLRENFPDLAEVPWSAAADVLLSGLCQSIGYDLFEMNGVVRAESLEQLKNKFGRQRIWDLGTWMEGYILEQLALDYPRNRGRERVQHVVSNWTALCSLNRTEGRAKIEQEIRRMWADLTDRERLYLSSMVESFGEMFGEPILLTWAEQIDRGEMISSASPNADWATAEGITLMPQVVQVATIRFAGDEPLVVEINRDPNLLREFEFVVVTVDRRGKEQQRETMRSFYFEEPLGNGVPPLELVAIPGDEFLMGSPKNEVERRASESPQHLVKVPPFFMGKYPVTQVQWRLVAGWPKVQIELEPNPARFKGDDLPIERVSWLEAQEFCARVSQSAGRICRLPTEAEWEYACRAGTTTPFHFGKTISTDLANYDGKYVYGQGKKGVYRNETISVGSFGVANAFGLYDMHGNVWEWCADHWHDSYQGAPKDGTAWIDKKAKDNAPRILRGGSWFSDPGHCRSACRVRLDADDLNDYYGFRVVYSRARTS
jgi:formylglycine-generating enzyme required for sulfatase activity